jgi:hypothetical protein
MAEKSSQNVNSSRFSKELSTLRLKLRAYHESEHLGQ